MSNRKIEVLDYDKNWPAVFETEKALLLGIIRNLTIKIEHIGSTSVPNLAAKPIIDILVEVSDLNQLDTKDDDFRHLNYAVKGENGIAGRRYYQKGGDNRTHHIHAFQSGSPALCRHRAFKDYLIAHPDIADSYALIKKEAALSCQHDNELYMSLKNDFILKHEKLAVRWYGC